jgi:CENP-B N-terminal DNA-binding domain
MKANSKRIERALSVAFGGGVLVCGTLAVGVLAVAVAVLLAAIAAWLMWYVVLPCVAVGAAALVLAVTGRVALEVSRAVVDAMLEPAQDLPEPPVVAVPVAIPVEEPTPSLADVLGITAWPEGPSFSAFPVVAVLPLSEPLDSVPTVAAPAPRKTRATKAKPAAPKPIPVAPAAQQTRPKGKEEKIAKARALLDAGKSRRSIAAELGVAESTLRGWLK